MERQQVIEYFKGQATKAGVSEDKISSVLSALSDDALGKLFLDTFVPRPEFSSALDAKETERAKAAARAKELTDWYEQNGKPAYEQNKRGIERLKLYESRYGDIEGSEEGMEEAVKQTGLSMSQVEEYVNKRLTEQGQLYVGLTKTAVSVAQDHMMRFKEPLDVEALEKLALEKGLPLNIAYKEYIEPKVLKQQEETWEAKVKAAREEGYRDGASKARVPGVGSRDVPHPLFDAPVVKEGENPDRASRSAFMEGWDNYQQETAK